MGIFVPDTRTLHVIRQRILRQKDLVEGGMEFLDSMYEFYIVIPRYLFEHVLNNFSLKYMKISQVEGHVISNDISKSVRRKN